MPVVLTLELPVSPLSYPGVGWDGWVTGVDNRVGDYCVLLRKPNFSLALELPECR